MLYHVSLKLLLYALAEIVVGLEKTLYVATEGDVLSVCVALLNGTLSGDTSRVNLNFLITTVSTDPASNCELWSS